MPKQRITKEMVVEAAFEIARKDGLDKVIVKSIAEKLNCSVQPIYSYCQNMEGLKQDVTSKVNEFVHSFIMKNLDKNDLFKSTGKIYVRLAKDEPHLFKIYVFQQRNNISSMDDLYQSQTNPNMAKYIADDLNISLEKAKDLHLDMLIYTIGISTILSVTTPGIPSDEIYKQQERAYDIFLNQMLTGRK